MKTEYDIMIRKFQKGEITEYEWGKFCDKWLDKILEENKEIFIRLKYR